jgi:hypothetical protein
VGQRSHGVKIVDVDAERDGAKIEGHLFCGAGPDVVLAVSETTGQSSIAVLDTIVHDLLVQKGADWTSVILSEYLGVYDDSLGTFAIVWDRLSGQLVAHGSAFQSASHPWAGLLAHIRTLDGYKGLGLGTLVTREATAGVFERGGEIVVLETDDKLHRLESGGRAAHSMYSRLGYTILGEKRLADTVDWMMAVDELLLAEFERWGREAGGGATPPVSLRMQQEELVFATRASLSEPEGELAIEPVSPGDLANLFLLLNLCPPDDFRVKLLSWHVEHGPELERAFIATLRQGIIDQDRLQDATTVLRDGRGAIAAVAAARQLAPFTRQTFAIDFYCLPALLASHRALVVELVEQTIARIAESPLRPNRCRLEFQGADAEKITLFASLGFEATGESTELFPADGGHPIALRHFVRKLG